MEDFFMAEGNKTPLIHGVVETGELTFKGRCIPEDAKEFFVPFLEWLEQFCEQTPGGLSVNFELDYFNTSTSKILLDIMKLMHGLAEREKKELKIIWYYDEDDWEMEETGLDYQAMVGNSMEIKSKKFDY